ncbi:hypothetical protein [uncultured Nostoc sp.]|uniref:hypothetical protein n=1 Tax=uncultured Nostoc sp. TaxID=340711 RepID=UPI0035C97CF1
MATSDRPLSFPFIPNTRYPTCSTSGVNFGILGVWIVVAVGCYPKLGVGDCGRGGERLNGSDRPISNAQYPISNAQCSMPNVLQKSDFLG